MRDASQHTQPVFEGRRLAGDGARQTEGEPMSEMVARALTGSGGRSVSKLALAAPFLMKKLLVRSVRILVVYPCYRWLCTRARNSQIMAMVAELSRRPPARCVL
jgi:hypothetical protein